MIQPVVLTVGALLVALTMSGVAQAQNAIQIQGTIQAVDCRANALVVNARDGTHVLPMAPGARASIGSAGIASCALRQYVGRAAVVSVAAVGNQLMAVAVDVSATAAPGPGLPPAVPPLAVPGYGYSGPYSPYYGTPYDGAPYYGSPYCYGPYAWGPYYGSPYCSGSYAYYPYYYGPAFFGIGIGFGFGRGFHDHDRGFDRGRRSVGVRVPGSHHGEHRR